MFSSYRRFCLAIFLLFATYGPLAAATHFKADGHNPSFARELMNGMAKMDRDMMAAPMTGDPDHDFASMMIPHHLGAVDMAKAELLHGKDPILRRLAVEIIVTQRQEVDVMRLRLAKANSTKPGRTQQLKEIKPTQSAPVYGHDRVYTGDQTSNTVSVINPMSNKLLGVIRLGDPVPGALSPLYRGQLLVHGIGFSPDHKTLAVISIGSNSVTFIETATNSVKGVLYIGRSPHEGFFTPNGKELWVTVRGENYLSIIDPIKMKEVRRIQTASGPGMVLFRPDGRYAFVPSSFTPELAVVDAKTYKIVARVPQASPFSPNLAVSKDGTEVWFTLKDTGKTQIMSGQAPFRILQTLNTGPISNHVALVDNAEGKFAYVTVGGENLVKVYRRDHKRALVARIRTGDLPHGIWQSGDGSRVYVGLENQDAVVAIDTRSNQILATIAIGQQPQALVYVPNAVPAGLGLENLLPLGRAGEAEHLSLSSADGAHNSAHATVSINSLGPLDLLQVAASGLAPGKSYQVWLVTAPVAPFGERQPLVTFRTNPAGAQIAQAIGPFRQVLTAEVNARDGSVSRRFLIVPVSDGDDAVLIQDIPARH
jgi:YVTN family beta-propeller protein